jgi:GT2 family glycosyltransferase
MLQLAVESALAQTYPEVETIVVDDGSTDATAELVARYSGRIIYLRQANQGVAAARNAGIQAASGDYLTCLDDDDLILPTKIERQVELLACQPEIGLVHCRFYRADESGHYLDKVGLLPEGEVLGRLVRSNFVWASAPLVPRHCFDQVGLFDEKMPSITADWDMWLRIARAGYHFACVQEPLGVYRIHLDSMMSNVARLEHGTLAILESVFSDPHVPPGVIALKEQACGRIRFWLSCRYYAAAQWDDAQRNLCEALALRPDLLADPYALTRLFAKDALSARVADPLEFAGNVLEHLPSCAQGVQGYRAQFLGQIYFGLAMRAYGANDIDCARTQLSQAIALAPSRFKQAESFARGLCHCAVRLPVSSPTHYVDVVLQNLPAQAQHMNCVRKRVLGELNVKLAYQDYLSGRRGPAIHRILTALRHRPSLIGSRSAISILLRSLLGPTAERRCSN